MPDQEKTMKKIPYWADQYIAKQRDVRDAIRLIKAGQRVFIGSSCGQPQYLVKALSEHSAYFTDIEIVRLMSYETAPLSLIASQSKGQAFNIRSFYLGSAGTKNISENLRFITPINLSEVPRLFRSRKLPIHVAMIQVTPPDDFGWMSLGVSVDITLSAALSADLVIAQVNSNMPRVLGQSFLHVNDVDIIVEHDEEILTIGKMPNIEAANVIARHIARLVEDGSTIQIGMGATSQSTLLAFSDKNDLGVHTRYVNDDMMHLMSRGVITNRKKGFNDGKLVASGAIGSHLLYEFLDDNPSIEFHPSDYVNDPGIIARHNRMVVMNVASYMDLSGQVAADASALNHFSGVSGMLDFMRGAARSEGGKSVVMMTSTTPDGKKSRIVPKLDLSVVVPRGDVQYVVTEYGSFNMFGRSIQERAIGMISIAHPDFREELFHEARKIGMLGPERTIKDYHYGVYPVRLEETIDIEGEKIIIRPAKAVDERRIQEHFYNLDKEDILSRFFHERNRFVRDELRQLESDYVKNLTMLAIRDELGNVISVGEYLLNSANNMAEVAFTVHKAYQGKGLGRKLMKKLAEAARENGISGLFACTSPGNRAMIRVFRSLPYKISTSYEDEMIVLSCKFNDPQ